MGGSKPSLCMQGDSEAAKLLLDAIAELAADGEPAQRTLTLRPNRRPKAVFTLRMLLSAESDDLQQMSLTRGGTVARLEFTVKGLEAFRLAVVCWRDGGEDFSLYPYGSRKARHRKKRHELGSKDLASGELWFWTPHMDP